MIFAGFNSGGRPTLGFLCSEWMSTKTKNTHVQALQFPPGDEEQAKQQSSTVGTPVKRVWFRKPDTLWSTRDTQVAAV